MSNYPRIYMIPLKYKTNFLVSDPNITIIPDFNLNILQNVPWVWRRSLCYYRAAAPIFVATLHLLDVE